MRKGRLALVLLSVVGGCALAPKPDVPPRVIRPASSGQTASLVVGQRLLVLLALEGEGPER